VPRKANARPRSDRGPNRRKGISLLVNTSVKNIDLCFPCKFGIAESLNEPVGKFAERPLATPRRFTQRLLALLQGALEAPVAGIAILDCCACSEHALVGM